MTRQELMDAISPASRRIVGVIKTFAGAETHPCLVDEEPRRWPF